MVGLSGAARERLREEDAAGSTRAENGRSVIHLGSLTFALVLAFFAPALAAQAQQAEKIHRIGFLSFASAETYSVHVAAFRQGLRELGYLEGRDIVIQERYAAGNAVRLREQAVELVGLKVDIIVVHGGLAARAANEADRGIPVVLAVDADPVGTGLVVSLARPGGYITGLADFHGDLGPKRLGLLREAVPSARRVAVLWNPVTPSHPPQLKSLQATAPAVGVTVLPIEVRAPVDIDPAFAVMKKERIEAFMVLGDTMFSGRLRQIAERGLQNRLASIYTIRHFPDAGGLMSYGTDFNDLYRRAATYVDKIFKGAKPADLPIEQPTQFDLVINLKTAKQLGLTIPHSLMLQADLIRE